MQSFIKYFTLLTGLLLSLQATAERFSYVYIQGDKKLPFYVKMEDEMLPRYSKYFCIIPQLAAAPIQIQILFQQNDYPPQTFHILVPQDGHRGFLLTRINNSFALYDLQQKFYLLPGTTNEDRLPATNTLTATTATALEAPKVTTARVIRKNETPQTTQPKTEPTQPAQTKKVATKNEPEFMEGIELTTPNGRTHPTTTENANSTNETNENIPVRQPISQRQQTNVPQRVNIADEVAVEEVTEPTATTESTVMEAPTSAAPNPATTTLPQVNRACPEPIGDEKFDDIYLAAKAKNNDEKRIGYLIKKAEENCYSSRHAFLLARLMQAESLRYSFLKAIYPKITDQQNFPLLADALFQTLEWKSYFRLIYE